MGIRCGHLRGVTGKALPTCWSWATPTGAAHMIAEGAVLQAGAGVEPTLRTLCGQQLRIDVSRRNFNAAVCDTCTDRLSELIAAAMADQP